MIIEKTIIAQPYYVPLSAHKLVSYTVNLDEDVVTANLKCYFNKEAAKKADAQPLAQYSIVVKGKPTEKVVEWIGQQLIATEAERVDNEYNYPGAFQIGDRLTFAGGEVINEE